VTVTEPIGFIPGRAPAQARRRVLEKTLWEGGVGSSEASKNKF